MNDHGAELDRGDRFRFGENWSRFLRLLDENRIGTAEESLRSMLQVSDLRDRSFLDIGSGSGLMSLAARRLGASVTSFDYDPQSVACTEELRNRFFPGDDQWKVTAGSVLARDFIDDLGRFDIVYSWGVLHHTGAMWEAIRNASDRVAPNGKFFIAIYNDQGSISRYWRGVKKLYNRNLAGRLLMTAVHIPNVYLARVVARTIRGERGAGRGMSLWYDMIDWLGGYPFEVARPEEILDFLRPLGFELTKMKTCGGRYGCNEFVLRRRSSGTV